MIRVKTSPVSSVLALPPPARSSSYITASNGDEQTVNISSASQLIPRTDEGCEAAASAGSCERGLFVVHCSMKAWHCLNRYAKDFHSADYFLIKMPSPLSFLSPGNNQNTIYWQKAVYWHSWRPEVSHLLPISSTAWSIISHKPEPYWLPIVTVFIPLQFLFYKDCYV